MNVDIEISVERPYSRTPQRLGRRVSALFAHEQCRLLGRSETGPIPDTPVCAGEVRGIGCERPESAKDRLPDNHWPFSQSATASATAVSTASRIAGVISSSAERKKECSGRDMRRSWARTLIVFSVIGR